MKKIGEKKFLQNIDNKKWLNRYEIVRLDLSMRYL